MIKLDTPINWDLGGFLSWWSAELSFLIPTWLRKMLVHSHDYLIMSKPNEFYELWLVSQQPRNEFGRIVLDDEGRKVWYRLVSRNASLQNAKIVLRLLNGQGLQKTITLPAAAQNNMRQVVGFEMERLTPFREDQVYYDVRLSEKLPESNQIKVELVLVPRAKLDDMLKEMVGLGLLPSRVDFASSTDPDPKRLPLNYNLLPEHLHDKPDQSKKIINAGLFVLLLALITLSVLLPIWMKRGYMQELEDEVERTGKVAADVRGLKEEAEDLLRETDFLLEKKSTEPIMVEMLNELSFRIPDNTWLTNINYNEKKLQIHGNSPSASALIEVIEASPYFEQANFVSPVNEDRNTGLERFQIATSVVGRRDLDQSAE